MQKGQFKALLFTNTTPIQCPLLGQGCVRITFLRQEIPLRAKARQLVNRFLFFLIRDLGVDLCHGDA
jgi:hypothetical protein